MVYFAHPDAVRCNLPWLARSASIASYSPRCAVANPRTATPAVARAMIRAGGTLLQNCDVTQVDRANGLFTLSGTGFDLLTAPVLVNAAGGWAGALAKQFNEEVPLFSAGPPQFVTEPLPYVLQPSVYAIEGDMILRQTTRGNFIFAGYPRTLSNPDGHHTFVPPHKTLNGMRAVATHIPALRHAEVMRVWSGVEGYLPDMLPIIGPSQTTPGLFHAFGGSGGGFQIAPAVGECLAQLICGKGPPPSISAPTPSLASDRRSKQARNWPANSIASEPDNGQVKAQLNTRESQESGPRKRIFRAAI